MEGEGQAFRGIRNLFTVARPETDFRRWARPWWEARRKKGAGPWTMA